MSDKNFNAASFDRAKLNSVFNTENDVKALLNTMETSCPKYIPTGFSALDNVLNGGLTASLYVLGAMPSLGKSTFLINMSEKIAYGGTAVLYFSFEMPADHIARGTFCRCLFNAEKEKNGLSEALKKNVSAARFLKENEFEKIKKDYSNLLETAFERYKKIGENFYVIDKNYISGLNKNDTAVTASFVKSKAENFIAENKNAVIIIDYLQLLQPEKGKENLPERVVVDRNIAELREIAHSHKVPVITISSINRTSYSEPITLSSFKESGGIEFSADIVWGLQLKGAGEKKNIDTDKAKNYRELQLVVLKNRYGSKDHNIDFRFYTGIGTYFESSELPSELKNEAKEADTAAANSETAAVVASEKIPEEKNSRGNKLKGYINNSKVANTIIDTKIKTGEKRTVTINDKKNGKVSVCFKLAYKGGNNSENADLTFMDFVVMEAALSHYYNYCRGELPAEFTSFDLLKFMAGRNRMTDSKTRKDLEEKIEKTLWKLNNMEMTLDITEECKMREIDDQTKEKLSCLLPEKKLAAAARYLELDGGERIIMRGRLLPLSHDKGKGSFRIKEGSEPLLYEYGDKISGQIITYSPELLTADKTHLSETSLLERYYLIHKIEILNYNRKLPPKIDFHKFKKGLGMTGMIPTIKELYSPVGDYFKYINSDEFKSIKKNIINETTRSFEHLKNIQYIKDYSIEDDEAKIQLCPKKQHEND